MKNKPSGDTVAQNQRAKKKQQKQSAGRKTKVLVITLLLVLGCFGVMELISIQRDQLLYRPSWEYQPTKERIPEVFDLCDTMMTVLQSYTTNPVFGQLAREVLVLMPEYKAVWQNAFANLDPSYCVDVVFWSHYSSMRGDNQLPDLAQNQQQVLKILKKLPAEVFCWEGIDADSISYDLLSGIFCLQTQKEFGVLINKVQAEQALLEQEPTDAMQLYLKEKLPVTSIGSESYPLCKLHNAVLHAIFLGDEKLQNFSDVLKSFRSQIALTKLLRKLQTTGKHYGVLVIGGAHQELQPMMECLAIPSRHYSP